MSKICKQCGVKYSNSTKKCTMCGTEFQDTHVYEKRKKYLILGVIALLLVAAAVTLILMFTGPKGAVRRIMIAQKQGDVDAIIAFYPDFLLETDKINWTEYRLGLERSAENSAKYIFSYNIEKAETPNTRECEEMIEIFRYYAGEDFDETKVTEFKMIWVNYKSNVQGFWPSHATRFIMFKYEGRWCWWPSNVNR
ncbi:MAG: hypothetical protein IJX28_08485 [Clostridia bacterium]|nr:hypothetical protein [Clostridia bacterium]